MRISNNVPDLGMTRSLDLGVISLKVDEVSSMIIPDIEVREVLRDESTVIRRPVRSALDSLDWTPSDDTPGGRVDEATRDVGSGGKLRRWAR